jgi:hypothetical protein
MNTRTRRGVNKQKNKTKNQLANEQKKKANHKTQCIKPLKTQVVNLFYTITSFGGKNLIIISKVAIVQWHLLNPKPNFKSYITPK